MLNASKTGNNSAGKKMKSVPLDPGTYPGRLVNVIDLGLQEQKPYQGKAKPPINELMTAYELADEFMLDENDEPILNKPRFISETFPFHNLSAEKARSTARYRALDPDGVHEGDWTKLLGTPCNITIVVEAGRGNNVGKVYENIAGVSSMRKKDADKMPELVNPVKVFDLDNPNIEVFMSLPEWVREKIKRNLNYNGSKLQAALKDVKPETKEEVETELNNEDERPY